MKDQLISFETAKLLRRKGAVLDYKQAYVYRFHEHEREGYEAPLTNKPLHCDVPAPTQSLLQKWLREEYAVHICYRFLVQEGNPHEFRLFDGVLHFWHNAEVYPAYEDGLEVKLQEALKLIPTP